MRSFIKLAFVAGSAIVLATAPALADGQAPSSAAPATAAPAAAAPASAAPAAAAPAAGAAGSTAIAPLAAPAPGSAGAAEQAPAAAAAAGPEGTLLVHVDSDTKINLEHRAGPGAAWEFVCESPCDKRLPVGDQYRVVGPGMNDSNPFTLDGSKGDRAVLYVSPGSKTKAKIGTGLLIGGAVVLVGAVVVGLAAACPSCTFQANGTTDTRNTDVIGATTGLAVLGLSTGIFGAAWMIDNSHSRVSGAVQAAPPARGSNDPTTQTGMRLPMPALSGAVAMPVFKF